MTQRERVLDYLKRNESITPMEAFHQLGITKLATVVSDMIRHGGVPIVKERIKTQNRYGQSAVYMSYSLRK